MVVVGFKRVKFKPSDTDDEVNGYSVFLYEDFTNEKDARGGYTDKVFLSLEKFNRFNVEQLFKAQTSFDIYYNRYGKIEKFVY